MVRHETEKRRVEEKEDREVEEVYVLHPFSPSSPSHGTTTTLSPSIAHSVLWVELIPCNILLCEEYPLLAPKEPLARLVEMREVRWGLGVGSMVGGGWDLGQAWRDGEEGI